MGMSRAFIKLLGMLCFGIVAVAASAFAAIYVVKEKDTLSTIVQQTMHGRIYGKRGGLEKLVALNPKIKNPNLIFPGDDIILSGEDQKLVDESQANRTLATADAPATTEPSKNLPAENQNKALDERVSTVDTLFKRGANLALTPYVSILSLEAEDRASGNASTVASKYDAGVTLSYVQDWSEKFHSQLNLKMGMVDFEKPTNSSRSLVDTQKFIFGLGAETSHQLSEKLGLTFGIDYGKELFIRSVSTQSETVDAVNVPTLGTKLSYDFANLDPFHFGVSGTYKAMLPASADGYSVKFGNLYGLSLYFNQRMKGSESKFLTELGFYQRRQDTSFSSQTESNIMATLRYFFSVGAREGGK